MEKFRITGSTTLNGSFLKQYYSRINHQSVLNRAMEKRALVEYSRIVIDTTYFLL